MVAIWLSDDLDMTEVPESERPIEEMPIVAGRIANSGEPIRFAKTQRPDGVCSNSALRGMTADLWVRRATTSVDPMFHQTVESFSALISHEAAQNHVRVPPLDGAKVVLYVMKADGTADLWIDNMAISMTCVVKRDVAPLTFIFEQDIADILERIGAQISSLFRDIQRSSIHCRWYEG
jgi:hypothetical protein